MPATVQLSDGSTLPVLGLGVWQVADDVAARVVADALTAGYRAVDTAAVYRNEVGVGRGIAASGLAREEVVVTTKVWNDAHGYDEARLAFDASLARLGLDRVDLLLVHWPVPARDRYVATFRALLALQDEGLVRSVGVSNFAPEHLDRLEQETGVRPVLNQVEMHPWFAQDELLAAHRERGVVTQAWSPLGQGTGLLAEPVLAEIAARLGATPAQVVLAWHRARGVVTIPKSADPVRLRENLASLDVELGADDVAAVSALDRGSRLGPDPATFGA